MGKQKRTKNIKREECEQARMRIHGHMILQDGRRNTQFRELASTILEMFQALNKEDDQASYLEAEKKLEKFIGARDESLTRLTQATMGGDNQVDNREENSEESTEEDSAGEDDGISGVDEANPNQSGQGTELS